MRVVLLVLFLYFLLLLPLCCYFALKANTRAAWPFKSLHMYGLIQLSMAAGKQKLWFRALLETHFSLADVGCDTFH